VELHKTTEAHNPKTRPCACTQNMGLSWSCLKTTERKWQEGRIM